MRVLKHASNDATPEHTPHVSFCERSATVSAQTRRVRRRVAVLDDSDADDDDQQQQPQQQPPRTQQDESTAGASTSGVNDTGAERHRKGPPSQVEYDDKNSVNTPSRPI